MIDFSHIYVERGSEDLPLSREIMSRVKPRHVTMIDDAGRFFKRPGQSFHRQKNHPKLIIARKTGQFLYRGSERVQSFGYQQPVYYNDMVRNCLFDCDYCFLQGMHRSANILLYSNMQDYLAAVDHQVAELGQLYLSISYLSDLLGFERSFGLVQLWIAAAREREGVEIEVRTKSDGFAGLSTLHPTDRVVFTWSISPDHLARRSEAGTASFAQRLFDARRACRIAS